MAELPTMPSGGIPACQFQESAELQMRKNLQMGGNFCMQISVNLHSGRFDKKSSWGEFLHADFSKSAHWQI